MEEKNKMTRWMITALMLLILAVILAGSLLPYLQIDLSGVIAMLPEQVAGIFNEMTELLGSAQGKIDFSAADLFRIAMRVGRDTAAEDTLSSLGLIIALPYLAMSLAVVFGLVRRCWSYIVSAVLSLTGVLLAVLGVVRFVPSSIYQAIPASLLKLGSLISLDFGEKFLRKQVLKSIGASWWICLAGGMILTGFSIAGIIVSGRKKEEYRLLDDEPGQVNPEPAVDFWEVPEAGGTEKEGNGAEKAAGPAAQETGKCAGIYCGFGELDGVEIPLAENETITVGKNSACCNVVAAEPEIEGVHCRIYYSRERACYQVQDLSQSGIYINGRRMSAGSTVLLPSGTILFLAGKYAVGLL